MKKNLKLLVCVLCILSLLCGCSDMQEPNDIAYVVALGIDKSDTPGDYEITIQFAKPVQISGGASEGGGGGSGEDITENVTFRAPTIYTAINLANQLVSKKFTLSHAKLIVFSEEVAREGMRDFTETMVRNMEIRPNIYMAVSLSSAKEYLEAVQPMIEINPVKYYQLIYENDRSIFTPNNRSQDFYFSQSAPDSNNVLPIANVLPKQGKSSGKDSGNSSGEGKKESGGGGGSSEEGKKESGGGSSEDGQSSEKGGSSESQGGSSSSKESGGESQGGQQQDKTEMEHASQEIPMQKQGFEYQVSNYIAGDMPRESDNQSEALGMAVFAGDKMIGIMGSIESELYNLITGSFDFSYISFDAECVDCDHPVTVRLEQDKKPSVKVDIRDGKPLIHINLYLEGEFYSLPADYIIESDVQKFQEHVSEVIKNASGKFMYQTSQELQSDITGMGSFAKRKFWSYQQFVDYDWPEKFKHADFDINVKFRIRRGGLTIRTGEK